MLESIKSPSDLKKFNGKELNQLAQEIRETIIRTVTENGGHLSSNLGIVELTVALHSVFDSPRDKIVFDVGHQSYAHKLLTGRFESFGTLRKKDGLAGFPKAEESEHDAFTAGHASTSISAALGMARARDLMGDSYHVVAVIGDGAITGGMSYEAFNDAGQMDKPLIVILNDNNMSIDRSVGAMSTYLTLLRQSAFYRGVKHGVKGTMEHLPVVGKGVMHVLTHVRDSVKRLFVNGQYFEALGFKYLGPVDGHDIHKLKKVLERAKKYEKPVLIHVVTKKGKGYEPAEEHPDVFHGVSAYFVEGTSYKHDTAPSFGKCMAEELVDMASSDYRICAITAAMPQGTGLTAFQAEHPDRYFDVGIAEEHAVTMAAGMAYMGLKPYVAIYSTFCQRAFDQLMMDVCLPSLPVTLVLDRAGLVGSDGATHQGAFDLTYLRVMPGMVIASPRDVRDLRRLMLLSQTLSCPMAIRYAKEGTDMGSSMQELEPLRVGEWELLLSGEEVMLLAVGRMVEKALQTSIELNGKGVSCGVIDARFVKPMDEALLKKALSEYKLVVTLEENSVVGGFGSGVLEQAARWNMHTDILCLGIPDMFIAHASVSEQAEETGLTPQHITQQILTRLHTEG